MKDLGANAKIFQLVKRCQENDANAFSDMIIMFQPLIKKYAFLLNDVDAFADMYDSFIDCIYKIPIKEPHFSSGDAVVLAYIKTAMKVCQLRTGQF